MVDVHHTLCNMLRTMMSRSMLRHMLYVGCSPYTMLHVTPHITRSMLRHMLHIAGTPCIGTLIFNMLCGCDICRLTYDDVNV